MKKIFTLLAILLLAIKGNTQPTLYGLTSNNGSGTISKYDAATNALSADYYFTDHGRYPRGELIQATDGKMYGMASQGGNENFGVLFSLDPATATYAKLKDFDNTSGAYPQGSLLQAADGKLYGMTANGGTSGYGVIFSFDPVTASYTKLKDFDYTSGANPYGSLLQASDGKLYGMTVNGGTSGYGVIFSFDPVAATYVKLKDFDYTSGAIPFGSLLQASDGKLYGMTVNGGASGNGVVFSFDPVTATYTKLKDFDYTSGAYPYGSLLQASDGKLYGMTVNGGTSGIGVIFSFDPVTASYTKLKDFDYTSGAYPFGSLLQGSDGKLYGTTAYGGASGYGVIFAFDPVTASYTKLKDFDYTSGAYPYGSLLQAADGKLYGMTLYGGASGYGVIFSFESATATYTKFKDFGDFSQGNNPNGSLVKTADGTMYGMTVSGGSSNTGVIFSYNPTTASYAKLKDFDNTSGAHPYGSLLQASDGKLYGMTSYGGTSGYGVIFSFESATATYTKLKDFDYTSGGHPFGSLLQAADGKLYGMTANGGASGSGVIFSFDPATATYTKLKDFDYTSGAYPYGSLLHASDGKLYGMTVNGGASGYGVIFSFDPLTATYTKLKDFDYTSGAYPYGSLLQAADGKLYGMTSYGGTSGYGVIFSFESATATYIKLKDFDYTSGAYPLGSLLQASDEKLYGMTHQGGVYGKGTVFSVNPVTGIFTKLQDFNGTNGGYPYLGASFIEAGVSLSISCPSNIAVDAATGSCTATVNNIDPVVVPNTATYSYTLSGATTGSGSGSASGLVFNRGETTVTYTLDDAPTKTCNFTVTVADNQPPIVTCPDNQTLNVIPNTCSANYTIADPISDNCTGATWGYVLSGATTASVSGIADGTSSGTLSFNGGITTVTLSGTDGINTATTCSFTVTVNKEVAGALNFDGTNDYVSIPPLNLNSNTITMEAWIKPNGLQGDYDGIVFSRSGNTIAGFGIRANNEIEYHWNNDGLTYSWHSGAFALANEWSHVALVVEPTRATIYLNGVPHVNIVNHAIEEFDGITWLGKDDPYVPWSQDRQFNGDIDEVRIWNRALCQSEIQNNMVGELTTPIPGLLAYYKFNQGFTQCINSAETSLTDSSGFNRTGTLTNFSLSGTTSNWNAGHVTGTAPDYDHTPPVITCPNDIMVNTDAGSCVATVDFNVEATDASFFTISSSNLPGSAFPLGTTIVTVKAKDSYCNESSCSFTVTVNKVTTTTAVTVTPITQQYSDKVSFQATVTPYNCTGADAIGGKVVFKIGDLVMREATVDALGVATLADISLLEDHVYDDDSNPTHGPLQPDSNSKTVTAHFVDYNTNYSVADATTNLTISCEDADVSYNGQSYFTVNPNNLSGTVVLSDYVVDRNDGANTRGDIRNATATFENGIWGTVLGTDNLRVGLVNPLNFQEGFVSTSFNTTLTSNEATNGGRVYDVYSRVNNYYCGTTDGITPVTLAMPGADYVTGGGHLVFGSNSGGKYAGTLGKKMNFGFVMKWNKSGKNLQGKVNVIYRRVDNGIPKVYQIKGTAIASLVVENVNDAGSPATGSAIKFRRATIVTKANLTDVTNPLVPISLGGNYDLVMTAWESTTVNTGALDKVGVQLSGSGSVGLLFSSNWVSGKTVAQTISGGKVQVRNSSTATSAKTVNDLSVIKEKTNKSAELTPFSVKAYPNPSHNEFSLIVESSSKEKMEVMVYDIFGRMMSHIKNSDDNVIRFGKELPYGYYIVIVKQGINQETIKLVKQE